MPNITDDANSAVEVDLVDEVKSCRMCQWFWGGDPPYGPYPSFDWLAPYPQAFRQQHPQSAARQEPRFLMPVKAPGYHLVDPAVMHGCRKAPIMTIGINPNMTSFYAGPTGSSWCYPHFGELSQYAYYYRYQTIYQESFGLPFIQSHIDRDRAITAEKPGWLIGANRCQDHRWMTLDIQYEGETGTRALEMAWRPGDRAVVLVPRKDPEKGIFSFQKGDVIAARMNDPAGPETALYENAVGYYQRFLPILGKLSDHISDALCPDGREGDAAGEKVVLRIGEDVSQHDMIGCASPGWSSAYDIPTEKMARNCVLDKAFALKQILQSRPAVIVLVGKSTLEMFGRFYGDFLDLDYQEPDPQNPGHNRLRDVFHLLRETCTRKKYLTIEVEDYLLRSRVIVCPHFSYYTNYLAQSRLSAKAWAAFQQDFSEDVAILKEKGLVEENGYNNVAAVEIKDRQTLQNELSVAAWNVLMAYFYDPNQMIANALIEAYKTGTLTYDAAIGRLTRTPGGCRFCDNHRWQFPDGCLYHKTGGSDGEPDFDRIVQHISRNRP